ncbi:MULTISPECIES: hypothetical protein [unclassified Streptomyces]
MAAPAELRARAEELESDVFAGHHRDCYVREGALCSCGFQPPTTATEE